MSNFWPQAQKKETGKFLNVMLPKCGKLGVNVGNL